MPVVTRSAVRRPSPAVALTAVVVAGQVASWAEPRLLPVVLAGSLILLNAVAVPYLLRIARLGVNALSCRLGAVARGFGVLHGAALLLGGVLGGTAPVWWAGTLSHLACVVVLAVATLLGPVKRLSGPHRQAFLAEITTVLAGGFMLVWYLVLDPLARSGAPTARWTAEIGTALADLLLLIAITAMLLRGVVRRLADPITVLVAGMALLIVADTAGWAGRPHGPVTENVLATCVVLANLLLALAPMRSGSGVASTVDRARRAGPPAWVEHLPLAALAVGAGLVLMILVREDALVRWSGLALGMGTMAAAIAFRQGLSLRMSRAQVALDPLTGLANRTGVQHAMARAVRGREPIAALVIDLDGVKTVTDAYGHAAGDAMLLAVAGILRASIRSDDLAARVGADEFAVLLTDIGEPDRAVTVARRILAAAAGHPVVIGADRVTIRLSAGVAVGQGQESAKALLRRADIAMYHAKRAGAGSFTVHHPSMTDRRTEEAALAEQLETALARGQFEVVYQPIVELAGGRPVAAEALLRWHHPELGPIPPARFIPVAERSGEIVPIGLWVLEQACRQVAAWRHDGRDIAVSVNLSPRQLQEPSLVQDVLRVLERTGVPARSLLLEVTESATVDERSGIAALRELRSHGIRIAVDDFGTGYSSLQYLTRLPVDVLKIDRSFVAQLDGTPEGAAIVAAVIRLAQVLHLTTVAEGVETGAQAAELLALGSDRGQGYLFSRPVPPAGIFAAPPPALATGVGADQ
jgi:diguanylate cyclase (GGDEF)-like protein